MKKLSVLCLILFLSNNIRSQNWDLFPKDQKTFYETSAGIEILLNDSVKIFGDTTFSYFNSKQPANKCLSKKEINALLNNEPGSVIRVDSLYTFHDTTYIYYGSDKYKFFNLAHVGSNWKMDNSTVTITCDSTSLIDIFGISDSVKYFSSNLYLPNPQFILSKNHGLIRFIPFYQLFTVTYDMDNAKFVGIERNNQKQGITTPTFSEFFHLSAGDILYWQYYNESSDIQTPVRSYYYKDSITSVIKTQDSVIYKVNGHNSDIYTYYKKDYSGFLNTNTNSQYFASGIPFSFFLMDNQLLWQTGNFQKNDSLFEISYRWDHSVLDTSDCNSYDIFDTGFGFTINTKVGLSTIFFKNGMEYTENSIVGYVINGLKWGKTDITTDIYNPNASEVKIYPNPVSDKLFVDVGITQNLFFNIIDISGNVVKNGILENGKIDLSNLADGVYFLTIENKLSPIIARIIKLNNQ